MFRVIYIRESERLYLKLDNLIVVNNGEEYAIPLSDISTVLIENNKAQLTTRLLCKMMEYRIEVIMCNEKMLPTGMMLPYYQHSHATKMILEQIRWSDSIKDYIWREIVRNKIRGQIDILNLCVPNCEQISKLLIFKEEVELQDKTNREGLAAKLYFRNLFGVNFIRFQDTAINDALNYGYTILRASICRIIVAYGLIPSIGFHHKNEFNPYNLADDLIEVFRPIVDWWVFQHMNEMNYLSRENRYELIQLLNGTIVINKKRQVLNKAIELYLISILNFIETGDTSSLVFPDVFTFQEDAV